MANVVIIDDKFRGPLYHNAPNQIRREIGKYENIYIGDQCGTVRGRDGRSWDWWTTDEPAAPGSVFKRIVIVPAS